MRDVYKETRLRVTCYMAKSTNKWIKVAWKRETLKDENSMIDEVVGCIVGWLSLEQISSWKITLLN